MSDMNEDEYGLGGEYAVGGFWGSVWGKFKGAVKEGFKSKAVQGFIGSTLDKVSPGAGSAIAAGMKVIGGAKKGDAKAVGQVVGLASAAKGGDANAKKAAGMLSVVNEAYNEVKKEGKLAKDEPAPAPAAESDSWFGSTTKLDL